MLKGETFNTLIGVSWLPNNFLSIFVAWNELDAPELTDSGEVEFAGGGGGLESNTIFNDCESPSWAPSFLLLLLIVKPELLFESITDKGETSALKLMIGGFMVRLIKHWLICSQVYYPADFSTFILCIHLYDDHSLGAGHPATESSELHELVNARARLLAPDVNGPWIYMSAVAMLFAGCVVTQPQRLVILL